MIQENNPEVLKTLDRYSNCINELLHQGFEILKNVRESSFSNEEHASFILLFRETLAFVDAIVPLIRLPSKEGVSIILRSICEADLYLRYMIEKDVTNRILAYQVCYAREKLLNYEKHDLKNEKSKSLLKNWKNDEIAKKIPFIEIDYAVYSIPLVSMLSREPFKSIDQEYKRIKKVNGKPKWYSLWDGPRTIEDLFRYMNRPIIYEEIYRTWSGIVHPNASFSNIVSKNGEGGIPFLHIPDDIPFLFKILYFVLTTLYLDIICKIVPDYKLEYAKWYMIRFKPIWDQVKDVKFESEVIIVKNT